VGVIEEFERQLRLEAKSNGAFFVKADFHLHSPASHDYKDKSPRVVEELSQAIRAASLEFAVVLEHAKPPDPGLLDEIQRHCPSATLVPGAELNVFVDALQKQVEKEYFFHCILAGEPTGKSTEYILHKAKEEFSVETRNGIEGFTSAIRDLGNFFLGEGALFIPAHLHKSKDPGTSRSIDDIYGDDAFLSLLEGEAAFSALEVTDPNTASFFTGDSKTDSGRDIPAMTCVRSSDAHAPNEIAERSRWTWVKVEKPTFADVRAALSYHRPPRRVSIHECQFSHNRIIGVHIRGQFILDEWIWFNPQMNCLIGCKGSGKTALLECIRFVLGVNVPPERREQVSHHVSHILGAAGYVECLMQRGNGSKVLVMRRADSPERLRVTEEDGTVREATSRNEIDFEISVRGWHEIETVAESATSRIELIDRVIGEAQIKSLYSDMNAKVERARDELPLLGRKLKRLSECIAQRDVLRRKRATLARLEKADLLSLQQQYEGFVYCEQALAGTASRLSSSEANAGNLIDNAFSAVAEPYQPPAGSYREVDELLENGQQAVDEVLAQKNTSKDVIASSCKTATEKVMALAKSAREAFAVFRESTYDPKVNALPPEEREILARQIQTIEETKGLAAIEIETRALAAEVRDVAGRVHNYCREICDLRDKVAGLRTEEVDRINTEAGQSIQVRFLRSANKSLLSLFQNRIGGDAGSFVSSIGRFGKREHYENMVALFDQLRNLDVEAIGKFDEVLWDVRFVDFMSVIDDDDVEISLKLETGAVTPIGNLSAGQRCTAVFPLLLRASNGPIVIDQPEDNLDNRHIARVIAPQLVDRKEVQQFILTSHNANLVVLTDADLIAETESDGAVGKIGNRGFLAWSGSEIKSGIVEVLDGGEEAIRARQRKYLS
jgi:energy-coupling factor transporter ATP-binding protein EcfA2